eukprot:gnl/TRDRNA2_/TRDRNA2_64809_c0_seq1.p1 gnl/TRDRNA2_/TRDRNA2_64809_c0~~gnl/TRDRNA2_/TRDRNA2_64809_c0_seq1.p1  ORF type:complete len:299 (+),score=49.54 gnl/TRDRNA2_/TRDRNA2_64809_c0_seq1:93-989(+)
MFRLGLVVLATATLSLPRGGLGAFTGLSGHQRLRAHDGAGPVQPSPPVGQVQNVSSGQVRKPWEVRTFAVDLGRRAHLLKEHKEHEDVDKEKKQPSSVDDEVEVDWIALISTTAAWTILIILCALCYRRCYKEWPEIDTKLQETVEEDFRGQWKYGLFECFNDLPICCWSFCCQPIRWADNLEMVGLLSFWGALTIMIGLTILNAVTGGVLIYIVIVVVSMMYRQKIREKFNIQNGDTCTYTTDFFTYLCCCCCATAQEARVLEAAAKAGHPQIEWPRPDDECSSRENSPRAENTAPA